MQINQIYHDVKVLLNLAPAEVENLFECKKDCNQLNNAAARVVYAAFYDSPTSVSFTGFMHTFSKVGSPQICGYNELFVLNELAKSPRILPGLKNQIDNLWNAFDEHRKLLETFRYETKVQNGDNTDRGGGEKG